MIAKALAANGAAKVYIIGHCLEVLEIAAATTNPSVIILLQGDITSPNSLLATAARIEAESGFINLVIASAGIMGPRPLKPAEDQPLLLLAEYRAHALKTPMEDFTNTCTDTTTGVYYTTLALLSLLSAGNSTQNRGADYRGQVIAVTSISGFSRLKGASFAYNPSKAATTHDKDISNEFRAVLDSGQRACTGCVSFRSCGWDDA